MKPFPFGHATHPDWTMAAGLVLAQIRAQIALHGHARNATLGLVYITEAFAPVARDLLDHLSAELPGVTDWAGTTGVGIASDNVEYWDEPALAVMLCDVPAHELRVFSGVAPLGTKESMGFEPHTALIHADPGMPDLPDLLEEMAARTATGYLFGGLASSRGGGAVQFAHSGNGTIKGHGAAGGVFTGGLSGVAFSENVSLVSRVTQGCQPISAQRTVTEADGNVILGLDGRPALEALLKDLGVSTDEPEAMVGALRRTLVGLTDGETDAVGRTGHFGAEVLVRHLIGVDLQRRAIAVAGKVEAGMRMAFCRRDADAARADLVRICAEIREELEPEELESRTWAPVPQPSPSSAASDTANGDGVPSPAPPARAESRIAGAIYVSCAGRGGPHFGAPSAELQIVRRALGEVPLVGFFAGGEIARNRLYGYTGVLTVFITPP